MHNYPTLKKTAKNPRFILSSAKQNIRSKQKRNYIFVEGESDSRFLKNIGLIDDKLKFDGFDGKNLVQSLLSLSKDEPYKIFDECFFVMDIDYDNELENKIISSDNVYYHGFCNINNRYFYNDLEVFLIQTKALNKILNEFDVDFDAERLRQNLLRLSFDIGIYRLADEILVKENKLKKSILDGLEIEPFIDISKFNFKEDEFKENVRTRTSRKDYVDDLFEKAENLKGKIVDQKVAIKGHDVTEILEIFLVYRGKHWAKKSNLEMHLRIGCEVHEFLSSELGNSLSSRELITHYLK